MARVVPETMTVTVWSAWQRPRAAFCPATMITPVAHWGAHHPAICQELTRNAEIAVPVQTTYGSYPPRPEISGTRPGLQAD
jgi:hypothetical protein